MKKILLILSLSLCILDLYSQTEAIGNTVSQGGHFDKAGVAYLSWAIGEVYYEQKASSDYSGYHTTDGVQQRGLITITGGESNTEKYVEMIVYPNPTVDDVYLKTEGLEGATYQLYDELGKLISSKEIQKDSELIPVNQLKPSTYILKVVEGNYQLKTFKILKH